MRPISKGRRMSVSMNSRQRRKLRAEKLNAQREARIAGEAARRDATRHNFEALPGSKKPALLMAGLVGLGYSPEK